MYLHIYGRTMANLNLQLRKQKEFGVTSVMANNAFEYDEVTGLLTHRKSGGRRVLGGQVGSLQGNGYMTLSLNGVRYLAHRVIWLMVKGEWPEGTIDHINGNRSDNRLANLRHVSSAVNAMNRSDALSYTRHSQNNSWVVMNSLLYGGTVKTEQEAKKLASYIKDASEMWINMQSVISKEVYHR